VSTEGSQNKYHKGWNKYHDKKIFGVHFFFVNFVGKKPGETGLKSQVSYSQNI
jgi:hypothetical protein